MAAQVEQIGHGIRGDQETQEKGKGITRTNVYKAQATSDLRDRERKRRKS